MGPKVLRVETLEFKIEDLTTDIEEMVAEVLSAASIQVMVIYHKATTEVNPHITNKEIIVSWIAQAGYTGREDH